MFQFQCSMIRLLFFVFTITLYLGGKSQASTSVEQDGELSLFDRFPREICLMITDNIQDNNDLLAFRATSTIAVGLVDLSKRRNNLRASIGRRDFRVLQKYLKLRQIDHNPSQLMTFLIRFLRLPRINNIERNDHISSLLNQIKLKDIKISSRQINTLVRLNQVADLNLVKTKKTEKILNRLGDLHQLDKLTLIETDCTGPSLSVLQKSSKLTSLSLDRHSIGQNAAWIASLEKLQTLSLRQNDISSGVVHLRSLTQLKELDLSGNNLTDDDVLQLATLVDLKTLYLENNSKVTAKGLSVLSDLTIEKLYLKGTRILSGEIAYIAEKFKKLTELHIGLMAIDSSDIDRAKKIRPNLAIHLELCSIT